MKIVFFGNASRKNAAIRSRVLKFAEMLASDGHTCIVCLPSSTGMYERLYAGKPFVFKLMYLLLVLLRRFFQLRHVPGADVVFFRGPVFDYGPPFFECFIHWLNPRMAYDIDDAVWERPAYVNSPFLKVVDFDWIWKMCGMCAHGIVGNRYLEAHVRERGPEVTVIPTCVDMVVHQPKKYHEKPEGPVLLGWTGLKDNFGYMEEIRDVLVELASRYAIALLVASDGPCHIPGVEVIYRRWRLEDELEYLQEPDIGLMPLTQSPRAQGKCAYKALEFMAVGTPCVISPVGMNAEIIVDGVTGFLAATREEWLSGLERLIINPTLRRRMGEAARQAVIQRYSHEVHYARFLAAMKKTARFNRDEPVNQPL